MDKQVEGFIGEAKKRVESGKKIIGAALIGAALLGQVEPVAAQSIPNKPDIEYRDGTKYIDFAKYVHGSEHMLSTDEWVSFTNQGECPPNLKPVRQYKNANYEQFCIGADWVYRREDTSGEVVRKDGKKGTNYMTYPMPEGGPNWHFKPGETLPPVAAMWAPREMYEGMEWQIPPHQVLWVRVEDGKTKFDPGQEGEVSNYPVTGITLKVEKILESGKFKYAGGELVNKSPVVVISGNYGERFVYEAGVGLTEFYVYEKLYTTITAYQDSYSVVQKRELLNRRNKDK